MINKLSNFFSWRQEVLGLQQTRQSVLATNIANADTPNYKARDFDFQAELSRVMKTGRKTQAGLGLSTTSERHIAPGRSGRAGVHELLYRVPEQPSLDGNTVDMERERASFLENSLRHQASLSFMKSDIQGLKGAMQPE